MIFKNLRQAIVIYKLLEQNISQARRKFVDFESEKGCKSQDRRMKTQTCMYWRKLTESIKNSISFDVIQVENFKIFRERLLLVVILCFRQWHIFQKWGVFQRSKGRGHEKFSRGGGKPPDPHFCSLRSHFLSAPPPIWDLLRRACFPRKQ